MCHAFPHDGLLERGKIVGRVRKEQRNVKERGDPQNRLLSGENTTTTKEGGGERVLIRLQLQRRILSRSSQNREGRVFQGNA